MPNAGLVSESKERFLVVVQVARDARQRDQARQSSRELFRFGFHEGGYSIVANATAQNRPFRSTQILQSPMRSTHG